MDVEEPTAREQPTSDPPAEPTTPPEDSTVGTGSIFAIGCSIVVLIIICVGVGIFMWRQVN